MKPLFAAAIFIFPVIAGSQDLPSLNVLLDRLSAYAGQYQATLPSLSCNEQITSQAVARKGKVTWQVKIQSTLREVRTEDPYDPFIEKREFNRVNGLRPKDPLQTPDMPYFVEGGFAGLVGFKRWEQRECFDYVVTPTDGGHTVQLEMALKPKLTNSSCAKLPAGFHRIVIADPETGRILHTERTISPEVAVWKTEVYFGGIDYAPQKLGEQTFWLPSRFYSHDSTGARRMLATYSNCHRYIGELKLLPAAPLPAAGQKAH
jgi:hypothetical protein